MLPVFLILNLEMLESQCRQGV
jgi:hypothetical protein